MQTEFLYKHLVSDLVSLECKLSYQSTNSSFACMVNLVSYKVMASKDDSLDEVTDADMTTVHKQRIIYRFPRNQNTRAAAACC